MRALLLAVCLSAPLAAQEPETVDLEGHVLLEGDKVRSGTFRIEAARDGGVQVRHVQASRRPRLRDLVVLVDEEGRVRVPLEPDESLLSPLLVLARELGAEQEGGVAERCYQFASALPAEALELRVGLLRELMLADPQHEQGLAALEALPPARNFEIWSEVARTHPTHPGLRAMLDERMPGSLRAASAPEGLRFLARVAPYELRVWESPEAVPSANSLERNRLGRAQVSPVWGRPDLIGLRTTRLFLITPLRDAGLLGECIARGELVLRALDELFAHRPAQREARYPLLVYLYESQEEYVEKGRNVRDRGAADDLQTHSAGNFSNVEEASRFFLPEGEGARGRLLDTFAHELTHHWLFSNCPAFTMAEARAASQNGGERRPGFWVVEGFADFVKEFAWDELAGSWDTLAPRPESLDILAQTPTHLRLSWTDVLESDQVRFRDFSPLDERSVPVSWDPQRMRVLSSRNLYYAQSAAVASYLFHAEDGRRREALYDYLIAYYTGQQAALDLRQAFGAGAGELGNQAILYARGVVGAE